MFAFVYHYLILFFLTMLTNPYFCLPEFTHLYLCLPMLTHVNSLLPIFTLPYFCLLVESYGYSQCLLLFTYV